MGHMKNLLITVHNGGDEAVAAMERIGHDWRLQLEQAADEVERLRLAIRRLAEQDATLSLLCRRDGSQVVTVTMDATLTDAEREAVEWCVEMAIRHATECDEEIATLRGLLDRLSQ